MIPYLNQPVTNRGGISKIGTTAVSVSTTDVTFTLPNHAFTTSLNRDISLFT